MRMPARLTRGFLALLMCAPAPACATVSRSGLLQWTYDDITVQEAQGRRHVGALSQSFAYLLSGPIGTEMIGEGSASVRLSQGRNLAQTVAAADSGQKILGYSFSGNLLPPGLRRFVSLAPSFSMTRNQQAWGSPQVRRDLVDATRGLTFGLSLPRLPSFSVSRFEDSRRDASAVSAVDQRTVRQSEQAAYSRGPLRLQYRHDRNRTADRLAARARTGNDVSSADAELNLDELKGRWLRKALVRGSYQTQAVQSGPGSTAVDSTAGSLHLSTRELKRGGWDSYATYDHEYSRASAQPRDFFRNSLGLVSSSRLRTGRLDNQLRYQRSDGRARQDNLVESLTAEWRSREGLRNYRFNAEGGWLWDQAGGATLTDSLRQRVGYVPPSRWDVYGDVGTFGSTPLRGRPGGSRGHLVGAGAGLRPLPATETSANYSVSRTRSFRDGLITINHSLTALAKSAILEGLDAAASYSLNWSRTSAGARSRSGVLTLTAAYAPMEGLWFSSEMTHTGRAFNVAVTGGYFVGKTSLQLRLQKQELYTTNSYSHLSLSLSRAL